jgi:pantoate--beta-alanine ligase
MKVFDSLPAWRAWRGNINGSIGFVPTMGALHRGHLSLIQHSLTDNTHTVASIYVNPTQFDNANDLDKYPRTTEQDLALLKDAGVDAVVMPSYEQLYPDAFRYQVTETELSQRFCGAHRPGHFTGMLSVVMKLLNLVSPQRAYFGEKDYQQLLLVRGMVAAFHLPAEIISCPIVRESDGLALSSRNVRLSKKQRQLAPELYRCISTAADSESARLALERAGFSVDYVEDYVADFASRRLAAVTLGDVRLIDNVALG